MSNYISKYKNQIKHPSADFKDFLNSCFDLPMIRLRNEEDMSVWQRLRGQELEVAKQMVLENLEHDTAYIKAIGIFRDDRGLPLLQKLVDTLDDHFCYEKLTAAKVLYDWMGYTQYPNLLKRLLPQCGSFTKTSLGYWINGIDRKLATEYIFQMLQDEDDSVRWSAYGTFLRYFKFADTQEYEETKYYTDANVYENKALFHSRLNELRKKVQSLI